MPRNGRKIEITARLGSARPRLATVDRDERAAVQMAQPDADREREDDGDGDGDRGELDMLERLGRDEAALVPEEAKRVRERVTR